MALSTGSFIRSSSVQSSHSHHNRSRRVSSSDPAMTSDPIATWSCYLKYVGIGGSINGSGIIVEFNVPHTELQSCLPGLQNLSSPPETSYALLTCHHTISDLQPTAQGGWWLYVGPGRRAAQKLNGLVCGVVSCCGENGIISCGSNRSNVAVLLPHQNGCCKLRLDFTMLLLSQSFEKLVIKQGMRNPPLIRIPSSSDRSSPQAIFNQIESDAAFGTEERMQLYHREESDIVVLPVEIDHRLSTSTGSDSHDLQQLKNEIATYKKYQRIYYTESEVSGEVVEGYSGSALVYYNPDTEETRLVGIHVGIATEEERQDSHKTECKWYIGVSIYGILQLLSGQPAAFFAVMEHHSARRMWPFRWAHLLTHKLETCKPEHLALGYLVEMLHHMLEKTKGSRLIQPDFRDLPENVLAALRVLIAVFKRFEISGHADVAAAICNEDGVFAGDEKEIKLFRDNVTELSKSFPDLLINVLKGTDDEEMAKACSECYNMMLNFKYEGIVQGVLHTGDSLAYLGQLRQRYKSPEILGNFIDILLKCRLIKESEYGSTGVSYAFAYEPVVVCIGMQ